jgi:3-oxoacyl-[acyl-carrier protein] reductase
MASYDVAGKIALVTGGGTGIGASIATLLARNGADVAIAGRRLDILEATAAEIAGQTGRRCLPIRCDVRDPDQVQQMVDKTVAALGRIDILINNAGGAKQAMLRNVTPAMWQNEFALNVHAAFYGSNAALPYFKAQGSGAIVNISSLAGVHGTTGAGAYSAAKAALQMLTQVASAEWGPLGIRVNCVAPGMTATPLAQANWAKAGFDATGACRTFPLRRPGTPEEVAAAVLFLASDAAAYITGEILAVGGGPQIKGMIDD